MQLDQKDGGKVRIQLDLAPKVSKILDEMVEKSGLSTRAELIRRAISIYNILLTEVNAGGQIVIVAPDDSKQRLFLY